MSHSSWTIMPDAGKESLETIAREITYCNEWDAEYARLCEVDKAEDLRTTLAKLGRGALDPWFKGKFEGSLHEVVEHLDGSLITDIVEAQLAKEALDRLMARRFGASFGFEGMRARLYVARGGVWRSNRYIEEGHGVDILHKKAFIKPGDVVEGRIRSFSSRPRLGGKMGLEAVGGFKSTFVRGLVDPVTAEPRVELDIFHKTPIKHR